jgi:hypothetical protein
MTDPRNIAHDKKVRQEKKHRGQEVAPGAAQTVQPGRKPHITPTADAVPPEGQAPDAKSEPDSAEQKSPR